MKKIFTILFITIISCSLFATIPPKKGVRTPPGFKELLSVIQKDYGHGYYAQKFRERKQLREEVVKGLMPASILQQDTAFALTLMGQYSDLASHYPAVQMQQHLFDGPNPTGTIKDYYSQISYDQLYFDGHCEGWYTVPGTLESYVGDNSGLGPDGGPRFVLDLIEAADPTFNFADYIQYYDQQNRPHIGFVAAIHTGADAAAGAYNIWSHRWTFQVITNGQPYVTNDIDPVSGQYVLIDGDYAIEPELGGASNTGGPIVAIGVFAHEFGHIFGLPDLYDTDYSSEGLGNWCLMAGGSWGGNGSSPQTPSQMSAWCKVQLGWVSPVNVAGFLNDLSLPGVEDNPVIYKMWRGGTSTTQYFLAENRQKTGFDINLPNSGLCIYHVDETQDGNTNDDHYLVDLEQADGYRNLNHGQGRGDAGDPYPGTSGNTRFDANTNPDSKDYNLMDTYVSVRNIHHDNQNMVADFDIGTVPYVVSDSAYLTETIPENDRVEPGESGTLNFVVHNIMPVNSPGTTITFSINEPGIEINQSSVTVPVSGTSTQNVSIPSAITVAPDFISRTIKINYTVTTGSNSFPDSFFVPIGIPEILLISKAEKSSLDNYYKASLEELGRYYEESFNTTPRFYKQRKAIILLTGRTRYNIFTSAEIDSLSLYLTHDGKLFFSGQNIAEYLDSAFTDFLHNTIGISWVKNTMVTSHDAYGISGDHFGDLFSHLKFGGSDGANNDFWADVIAVTNGFHLSLTYKDDGTDPAGGWIEKPGGGQVFFLGFGFESINNLRSSITRTEVMQDIMQWLNNPAGTIPDNHNKTFTFKLDQNYPNPFNPSTSINYEIPRQDFVSLKIYNLLGEEVATLVNEVKQSGNYTISFNAGRLSSGVYLYRITSGNYTSVKKMIVLK